MKMNWIAFCCLMTWVQDVGTHHTWILCTAVQTSSSLAHRYPLVQCVDTYWWANQSKKYVCNGSQHGR